MPREKQTFNTYIEKRLIAVKYKHTNKFGFYVLSNIIDAFMARMKIVVLARNLALTPSVQWLLDPAFSTTGDDVRIYSMRLRLIL